MRHYESSKRFWYTKLQWEEIQQKEQMKFSLISDPINFDYQNFQDPSPSFDYQNQTLLQDQTETTETTEITETIQKSYEKMPDHFYLNQTSHQSINDQKEKIDVVENFYKDQSGCEQIEKKLLIVSLDGQSIETSTNISYQEPTKRRRKNPKNPKNPSQNEKWEICSNCGQEINLFEDFSDESGQKHAKCKPAD